MWTWAALRGLGSRREWELRDLCRRALWAMRDDATARGPARRAVLAHLRERKAAILELHGSRRAAAGAPEAARASARALACAVPMRRQDAAGRALRRVGQVLLGVAEEEEARRHLWDIEEQRVVERDWAWCGFESAGERALTVEAEELWRSERALPVGAGAGARLTVWNGTGGQAAAARNWRVRFCLATWRRRGARATLRVAEAQIRDGPLRGWLRACADRAADELLAATVALTRAARALCVCRAQGLRDSCPEGGVGVKRGAEAQCRAPPGCVSIAEALAAGDGARCGDTFVFDIAPRADGRLRLKKQRTAAAAAVVARARRRRDEARKTRAYLARRRRQPETRTAAWLWHAADKRRRWRNDRVAQLEAAACSQAAEGLEGVG